MSTGIVQHAFNDFHDFTLVIPTYNRPELLAKLLNYCAKWLPKIIVLDSSSTDIVELNSIHIAKKNIEIKHLIFDTNINIAAKLFEGLSVIKTDYFSFCADDDVIFQIGLLSALRYIRSSSECVGVDGLYMNFNTNASEVYVGVEYAGGGFEESNPISRLCRMLQNYESRFYGVYRAKEALKVFEYLVRLESLHFQELMQSSAIVLLGKVHRLPVFYAARQQCIPADLKREKWQTYYWFAENPSEFFEHYLAYRTTLADFYLEYGVNSSVGVMEFFRAVDIAHSVFFSKNCPNAYLLDQVKSFCKINSIDQKTTDNLLQEFKSPFRLKVERKIRRMTEFVNIVVGSLPMPWHLYSLNREVRSRGRIGFRCVPAKRNAWILGHVQFRSAFHELCNYLES